MNGSKLCNSIIQIQHSKEQLFSKRIAIHTLLTQPTLLETVRLL